MDTPSRIRKVLQATAGTALAPAAEESLFTSGLLDSFALTDFITGLEAEFSVTIPDSDFSARRFDTIAKVEQYLDAKAR